MPNETTELCELAFKYGTDKCQRIKHPFTPYYFEMLKDKKGTIKKVLEIGIGLKRRHSNSPNNTMGASLYMWRDFFPHAQIYGADVDPQVMFTDERIQTTLCDQSVKTDLEKVMSITGSDIDFVIDDASHIPRNQILSCLTLMPLLKKDVIYVIEDVADANIVNELSMYDCEVIKLGRRPDDRLIIVKNKLVKKKSMIIDVYSNMYNEEFMLPYWLRHYETFADRIFVWDDHSTDKTLEILCKHPKVTLLPRDKHGHDDNYYVNTLYPQYEKYSRGVSDWVILADADEFIYHPKLREALETAKKKGKQIIHTAGFSMISESLPTKSGQIYDEIKMGLPGIYESKWPIHSSNIHIRYRKGRHGTPFNYRQFTGSHYSKIKLLHYRYLGKNYIESRDLKNIEQVNIAHPQVNGKNWKAAVDKRIRTCPNGEKMNILTWLAKHQKEAINVLETV